MDESVVFHPQLLQDIFENSNKPSFYTNSLRDFTDTTTYSTGQGFIQGYIDSEDPIISSLNHKTPLVLSEIVKEVIFSNSSKDHNERERNFFVKRVPEFYLTDNTSQVKVTGTSSADYGDALQQIESISYFRKMNPIERVLSWFLFFIKMFLSISNLGRKMSGVRIGYRKTERGLLLGQLIIMFGDIFYDKMNKEMVISNPKFFAKSKFQMVNKVRNLFFRNSKIMTIVATTFALSGILILRRTKKLFFYLLAQYRIKQEKKRRDKLYQIQQITKTEVKCVQCKERFSDMIFKPCLHLITCKECIQEVRPRIVSCQRCGLYIEDMVHLFTA